MRQPSKRRHAMRATHTRALRSNLGAPHLYKAIEVKMKTHRQTQSVHMMYFWMRSEKPSSSI